MHQVPRRDIEAQQAGAPPAYADAQSPPRGAKRRGELSCGCGDAPDATGPAGIGGEARRPTGSRGACVPPGRDGAVRGRGDDDGGGAASHELAGVGNAQRTSEGGHESGRALNEEARTADTAVYDSGFIRFAQYSTEGLSAQVETELPLGNAVEKAEETKGHAEPECRIGAQHQLPCRGGKDRPQGKASDLDTEES